MVFLWRIKLRVDLKLEDLNGTKKKKIRDRIESESKIGGLLGLLDINPIQEEFRISPGEAGLHVSPHRLESGEGVC